MKHQSEQNLGKVVNLVKIHPISSLYVLRKTFWLLMPFVCTLIFLRWIPYISTSISNHAPMVDVANASLQTISFVLGISLFCGMSYYFLKRRSYFYGIEEGQLVIARGIIIRERGYFQLSRITEVYLDRSFIDVIFGLYTLRISTPTVVSDKFARIDGLNEESALALQHHISLILEENYGSEVKDTLFAINRITPSSANLTQTYALAANAA